MRHGYTLGLGGEAFFSTYLLIRRKYETGTPKQALPRLHSHRSPSRLPLHPDPDVKAAQSRAFIYRHFSSRDWTLQEQETGTRSFPSESK